MARNNVNKAKSTAGFGSLFEEDYLLRTLGPIAHDHNTALTELVANAWDAGAASVEIMIPLQKGDTLSVSDDGHGMSREQFKGRWMKLAYNRERHQGKSVEFPSERSGWVRRAYGRNGVGRHGLLCFADSYVVETWRDGIGARYWVTTDDSVTPFKVIREEPLRRNGHGTKLSVEVQRHLPDADQIREILSARFLHDPQFTVTVNGKSIALPQHAGLLERKKIQVTETLAVEAFVVDSTKAARSTLYQGVAFWVNNRLVGIPSWVVGSTAILDGRGRFAKRYSIVISADADWIPEVEPDWSRFRTSPNVKSLQNAVGAYALKVVEELSSDFVDESSQDALIRNREELRDLSQLGRIEVANFTKELVQGQPAISPETLALAVQTVIKLEKSRSGAALLEKLTKLDESDIEGLDRLLGQWTIRDALAVLDEIDNRLAVIAAIEKLSADPGTDELHTLHPLVTQARWLFGPEFDSHEYASNQSLRNASAAIFKVKPESSAFINARQRPDLVLRADSTFSVVGTEVFDAGESNLARIQDVLIIELKKGKLSIGRDEMNQADGYVQDFMNSGSIEGSPLFRAYVVGHEISPKTTRTKVLENESGMRGKIFATTYSQLTRTANQRLFKLKEKIPARYEDASGAELLKKVMDTPSQALLGS